MGREWGLANHLWGQQYGSGENECVEVNGRQLVQGLKVYTAVTCAVGYRIEKSYC